MLSLCSDGENILDTYQGYLIFRVSLTSDQPESSDKVVAVVRQGVKTLKAYSMIADEVEKEPVTTQPNPAYIVNYYFDFLKKDIASDGQIMLSVTNVDKHILQFYFDLAQIK